MLKWVNLRQVHVAKGYVYLPDDPRKLRFRISRLFSRCANNHAKPEKGYLLMVEDPATSHIDTFNFGADRVVNLPTFTAAKAEAERMVQCGEVLLAPSEPALASVHPAL